MRPYHVTRILLHQGARVALRVGYTFAALGVLVACALLTGCATMRFGPTERLVSTAEADAYCRPRLRAAGVDTGPIIYGCWVPRENVIVADSPAVLAHERRHAEGWEHHGPCHSSPAHPDGVKLDGTPCDWYRAR